LEEEIEMAQTLGRPAKVGMVMPMRWWFDRNKAQQSATPSGETPPWAATPVNPPASDEPVPKVAAVPSPIDLAPKVKDESGGGYAKSKESIANRAAAGVVDNLDDFVKSVGMATTGPLSTMAFMGRLLGSGIWGAPGADIDNSNLDPDTAAKAKKAAEEAAKKPGMTSMAPIAKIGEDYLKGKKKAPGAGQAGAKTGGGLKGISRTEGGTSQGYAASR
jgi:hypothetical protein